MGWQKLELEQERALLAYHHPAIAQHNPLFSILFTLYVLPILLFLSAILRRGTYPLVPVTSIKILVVDAPLFRAIVRRF